MVYPRPKTVTHPGTNRARRALTSFMRRTPLTATPRCQPIKVISIQSLRRSVCWIVYRWCWCKGGGAEKPCVQCTTASLGHDGAAAKATAAAVTLDVTRATLHDAGDYALHGLNRHGHVRSDLFPLRMAGNPSVKHIIVTGSVVSVEQSVWCTRVWCQPATSMTKFTYKLATSPVCRVIRIRVRVSRASCVDYG